jgi:hypothetical protein
MEAEQCKIKNGCKQVHRADYRVWSEYFQQFLSDRELVALLNSGAPMADPKDPLRVHHLPF